MPGTIQELIDNSGYYFYTNPKKETFDILPNVYIGTLLNEKHLNYGLDTPYDINRRGVNHIAENFKHNIEYTFNSRGFRDKEWPSNLSDSVWCLGDSHTLGIGVPKEYIYTELLQQSSNINIINCGFWAATNIWLSLTAESILKEIKPKYLIIGWTHLTKRVRPDEPINNDTFSLMHFKKCMDMVFKANINTTIIHFCVPDILSKNELQLFNNYSNNFLGIIEKIDTGRDGFHIGIDTHKHLYDTINRYIC